MSIDKSTKTKDNNSEVATATLSLAPKKLRRLTLKQKLFSKEYVKSKGNGTKSAMKVYDTKDKNVAHAIASQNLQKATVKNEVDRLLQAGEYDPTSTIKMLVEVQDTEKYKTTAGDKIKAGIELLKLARFISTTKQSANVNYNFNFEHQEQAYKFNDKYKKLLHKRSKK